MTKTRETLLLEKALYARSDRKREYGCTEVTIGFRRNHLGDEIVDFMSMDAEEVFRCFEIKVSYADLKTDNKKSWYGDYNYLVISDALYEREIDYDDFLPPYVGILKGETLEVVRKAKQHTVQGRDMLKNSLLRSVYWKMRNYAEQGDITSFRQVKKELETVEKDYATYRQEVDRAMWEQQDYETYYACNHQLPSFSIEEAAKEERRQYALRKKGNFSWIREEEGYRCPCCRQLVEKESSYCPFCGKDLRKLS